MKISDVNAFRELIIENLTHVVRGDGKAPQLSPPPKRTVRFEIEGYSFD
jgi:hypothetical protein